ncbi:la-related protein 6-like [Melanotaenia boesemani]|uniref:la-related protein 6-like n=1 Tax=Melanotaenia boesemani TaxID=1250792 RepID=UPI001C03CA0D|nr:la-related protein 6-like [Melanotaenia boesemani]
MSDLNGIYAQSVQEDENCEDELLCFKIQTLLEEMFSDSHLAEDGFLLKHMQKNKMGYINIKLLTCLKKIKALTTNWYMTLAAAECSDLLEVNDECTKVRRKKPLPEWLLCSPTSRLLLVWDVSAKQRGENRAGQGPEDPVLLLRILQKFGITSGCTSVWILHPGEELPKELKCYAKRYKELGQYLCAVVKFDSLKATRRAYNTLKAAKDKSNGKGLCVLPLGSHSAHNFTKCVPSEEKDMDQLVMDIQENPLEISTNLIQQEPCSTVTGSGETPDTYQLQEHSNYSTQGVFNSYSQSCGPIQRYSRLSLCSGDCKESSRSPWVLKRKSAAKAFNSKTGTHLNGPCLKQRVLRQPFGPDETKGFNASERA